MKITAKSRYALRVLLDLAVSGTDSPRTIKEIAASQRISEKFISRIAVPLRRAGLVATERGVKGGLRLARFPAKITLLDIVTAMDGQLALVHCLAHPGICKRQGRCAPERAWASVNDKLSDALHEITLDAIAADQHRLAPPESIKPIEPDYCI